MQRIEIREFDRKNETATIGLRPAKFDLAITIAAIYKELIAFPVGIGFMDFICFRFRSRVVLLELAEVASLDFIVFIGLDLFLELILPVVIILERSPFAPAFTVGPSLDVPDVSNKQFMTAAFVTGKLRYIAIVHGRDLFPNQPAERSQAHLRGPDRQAFDKRGTSLRIGSLVCHFYPPGSFTLGSIKRSICGLQDSVAGEAIIWEARNTERESTASSVCPSNWTWSCLLCS